MDFQTFADALPPTGALIGIDPGAKRIGIAVCDPGRLIASPLATITRTRTSDDLTSLLKLVESRSPVGAVCGLPLNMDGTAGPAAQSARAFARNLLARQDWPLLLFDERLSTAAVTRAMIDADATRARRAAHVDQLAAAYVLQGVIDRLHERRAAS